MHENINNIDSGQDLELGVVALPPIEGVSC